MEIEIPVSGQGKAGYLGLYSVVSPKEARERSLEAKKVLASGKDLSVEKKLSRLQLQFENVAREWHEKQGSNWSEKY